MLASDESLKQHVQRELGLAQLALQRCEQPRAWQHLERAHILSQPRAGLHTRVHLKMLNLAWRQRDGVEVAGQLLRLLLAALASWLKRYPVGNTGRARVPLNRPEPVAEDLQQLLTRAATSTAPENR